VQSAASTLERLFVSESEAWRVEMEDAIEGKDFNFPQEEESILRFWEKTDAFKQQLKLTSGKKEYVFYDGPPFATGLPHYGHILAGTLKV
jgi:isoleucyl-tRNA synthetase